MAFPAEIAPSQGYPALGHQPDALRPLDYTPQSEIKITEFNHPLQQRIATELMPLLLEDGEGSPPRRLAVFRDRVDSFTALTGGLTEYQLDGTMCKEQLDEVVREASHIKIATMGVAVRLGIDIGSFMDKKMMEKMQEKYPPDDVYQLIKFGMTPLDAMAYLKTAYNKGHKPFVPHAEISQREGRNRIQRIPAFKDAYQDVADTWQRKAFGMYIRASERLPNLSGEIEEFFQEFEGMSESDVNGLARAGGIITAEEPQNSDPNINKLISIGGEAADISIAIDGYTAVLDRDQDVDANAALDRTISRYKKTKRLVREGMSEERAMGLLREVDHRMSSGLKMPYVDNPGVAAIIAGIVRI